MNLKKMWKRFWTLDVHNHAGFTLVELIIVIAILAILSSVAVAGYSAYIKKANIAADEALAAEIENALILAMYSNALTPGDYVVINYDGKATYGNEPAGTSNDKNSTIYAAMAAAYGDGWENVLELKWSGWTGAAAAIDVAKINASSFGKENLDTMMEDVSVLSGVLAQYLGGGVTYNPLKNYMSANNISTTDPQVLANLAVLQAANSITGADSKKFAEAYNIYTGKGLATALQDEDGANLDKMSAYAVAYAQMEGLINYISKETSEANDAAGMAAISEIRTYWTTESAKLTDVAAVDALLDSTEAKIAASLGSYAMAYYNEGTGPVADDAEAFLSYMKSVNEVAPSVYGDLTALASKDYYKGDAVSSMINNYIAIAKILDDYTGSAIVVLYDGITVSSYPIDYK